MSEFLAVVLAAGQGTRMKSKLPKVLHPLAGLPLVSHVLRSAVLAGATQAALVISSETKLFDGIISKTPIPLELHIQSERLGTAHAVLAARDALLNVSRPVVVLYGDTPLIKPESLQQVLRAFNSNVAVTVIGFAAKDPKGYGRLIRENGSGELLAIREEKDATAAECGIMECNSGILAMRGDLALTLLEQVGNANAASEFYLTDVVEIARRSGHRVACHIVDEDEVRGVNTRKQLAEAEAIAQDRLRSKAMENGATLVDPSTVSLAYDTVLGQDVLIEPNVFFGPGVTVEDDVVIKAFSHIEGAHIQTGSIVGPFARLRPGTELSQNVRVGNFVEIKASTLNQGAKVNHLSYIGNSQVGAQANVGAGTITCNYDGKNKHPTKIGEGAFIGSNTALVAPVIVGDNAMVGAGSVITEDVPANALALARGRQINREKLKPS